MDIAERAIMDRKIDVETASARRSPGQGYPGFPETRAGDAGPASSTSQYRGDRRANLLISISATPYPRWICERMIGPQAARYDADARTARRKMPVERAANHAFDPECNLISLFGATLLTAWRAGRPEPHDSLIWSGTGDQVYAGDSGPSFCQFSQVPRARVWRWQLYVPITETTRSQQ